MPSERGSSSAGSAAVPAISVVDLAPSSPAGTGRSSLAGSPTGSRALRRGTEQAVLIINRRGAATFILCRDCGESLRCPDCDLPFVYPPGRGHAALPPLRTDAAPAGTLPELRKRPHPLLRRRNPAGRGRAARPITRHCGSARLDSDALGRAPGFESVYDDFRDGRVDVLVGTQLAAKGLDLPTVTLAAVVAADVTLNLPDYRAAERTFQLLAQVAGRAGPRAAAGPGHHPDLRARAPRRPRPRPPSMWMDSPTTSSCGGGCSAIRRSASWLGCWSRDPDRARAEARGREAADGRRGARQSRSSGRCRRMSLGARGAIASRSSSARPTPRPRAVGPRAGAARRRHRRRPGVAPLTSVQCGAPWPSAPSSTADEPILRERTKRVSTFDASLHRLLDDMLETMRDAPGVGLAANQVGVPLQVAVIEIEGRSPSWSTPRS